MKDLIIRINYKKVMKQLKRLILFKVVNRTLLWGYTDDEIEHLKEEGLI